MYDQLSGVATAICIPSGITSFDTATGVVLGRYNGTTTALYSRVSAVRAPATGLVAFVSQLHPSAQVRVWSAATGRVSRQFVLPPGRYDMKRASPRLFGVAPTAAHPARLVILIEIATSATATRFVAFESTGPESATSREIWSLPAAGWFTEQTLGVGPDVLMWANGNTTTVRNVSLGTGRVHWRTPTRHYSMQGWPTLYAAVIGREALLVSTAHATHIIRRRDGAELGNTTAPPFASSTSIATGGSHTLRDYDDGFLFAFSHFSNDTTFTVQIDFLAPSPRPAPTGGGPGASYVGLVAGACAAALALAGVLVGGCYVKRRRRKLQHIDVEQTLLTEALEAAADTEPPPPPPLATEAPLLRPSEHHLMAVGDDNVVVVVMVGDELVLQEAAHSSSTNSSLEPAEPVVHEALPAPAPIAFEYE
jgi:hypothetical protein